MADWLSKLLFGFIVFITNIIQAITGFAGTVLAMPFSILLVGKPYCKPILNAIGLLVSLFVVIFNFKKINWKYILFIVPCMGVGMVAGYFLEKYLYNEWFLRIYGIIVCLIAIFYFFNKKELNIPLPIQIIIMVLAGLIHGIFVSGGPLLIIVAKAKIKEKDEFRATLSFVWIILNSIMFTTDIVSANFTNEMWLMLLILIPVVVGSTFLGKLILKHVSNNVFMKITCVLLFISGLSIVF